MLNGLHQNRVMTLYNNKGKVLFFRNSYHYKTELRLKLLNFSKFSQMRWPNILIINRVLK
jgi:hypothetical protein